MKSDNLLDLLRGAEAPLSGAALGRRLGLSRAAVHKRIEKLRASGHRIGGVNRLGYRLEGESEAPTEKDFRDGWGRPFHRFETVGSTQEAAKAAAFAGAPEGALFTAERQTDGRGRLGRRWESPAGGLWYSLVLRPALAPADVPGLALAAALDWARLLKEDHRLDARVKWPNDVWLAAPGGWWGYRKLAGVLAEMSSEADRVHWLVLGVGLNVNNAPPEGALAPAVSLSAATGRSWNRGDLLSGWMSRFRRTCRSYAAGGFSAFRAEFERFSLLRGKDVRFETDGGTVSGRAAGVDASGRLLVRSGGGTVVLSAGDVRPARSAR